MESNIGWTYGGGGEAALPFPQGIPLPVPPGGNVNPWPGLINRTPNANRSFVVDYSNNVFLKDGQPFRFIAGSIHYFRVPREYWRDRLRKLRAVGMNTVVTIVEWSSHEPTPRNYKFGGNNDIEHFIQVAIEEDLLVILQPGPFTYSDRDFGGLPPWLLTLYSDIEPRTSDTDYHNEIAVWFCELFGKIQKYLYGNGGPIIMIQIDDDLGNLNPAEEDHKLFLRDEMKKYVNDKAVLFTKDWSFGFENGSIEGVLTTTSVSLDYTNVSEALEELQNFQPRGPLVCSKFFSREISFWEEPVSPTDKSDMISKMKQMLDMNVNINLYSFCGGTNFGFKNGADLLEEGYRPYLTSYDYEAPLDEAGDPTPLYFEIRDLLKSYAPPPIITIPAPKPKGDYGNVYLRPVLSLFDESFIDNKITSVVSPYPKTFEEMRVNYGYMLYETTISDSTSDSGTLQLTNVRDRAIVFIDHSPVDTLERGAEYTEYEVSLDGLSTPRGRILTVLVENQGRLAYGGSLNEPKGLSSAPQLNGYPLLNWRMTGLPFETVSWIYYRHLAPAPKRKIGPPAFYVGELVLPEKEEPRDTYVDLRSWGKGVIFINDFNLGRYWTSVGPQMTLYVPGCYLRANPHKNIVVVLETDEAPESGEIVFTNEPIWE